MGLGRIYTSLGDFDQARDFYEMTDRRFGELKPNMQSYFLNNYGNYYYFHYDNEYLIYKGDFYLITVTSNNNSAIVDSGIYQFFTTIEFEKE